MTRKASKMKSPLIWFGGKGKVAQNIIKFFPEHKHYVEPFGGAAHVLAQKEPSYNEVYNDVDNLLVNFFLVLRSDPEKLTRELEVLPYSRQLYEKWRHEPMSELSDFEKAVRFFYLNRSGIVAGNGPGRFRTGWRHTIKAGANPAKSYKSACNILKDFAERIGGVMVEHLDFREIIRKYDSKETLFYVDPPYIGREKYYAGGFTEKDHRDLAEMLNGIEGKAIVSYYDDPLLLELYPKWNQETFEATKQVANGRNEKAIELLLMNFNSQQMSMF
jgi:DNA adenine methylase